MQRAVRDGLDLVGIHVIVPRHVLEPARWSRLDQLRPRDVDEDAARDAGSPPARGQAPVDGLGEPKVV